MDAFVGCAAMLVVYKVCVVLVQVAPEFVERYTPNQPAPKTVVDVALPAVARSIRICANAMYAPFNTLKAEFGVSVQELPPSTDFRTPHPCDPALSSPVPTYTMLGFTGSTATPPVVKAHWASVTEVHSRP